MQEPLALEKKIPAIHSLDSDDHFLIVGWDNGQVGRYPFIFLQDNAPGVRHANGQKLIETGTLQLSRRPEKISLTEDTGVTITWDHTHEGHLFPTAWLWQHDFQNNRPTQPANDPTAGGLALWDHRLNDRLPEHDYPAICEKEEKLYDWLADVQKFGFAILRHVPPVEGMILEVVRHFGFIRETNYGKIFDVRTVVNPNNLAFTGLGISAHTDNPYRDPSPTLQLLHCLQSDAHGGDSILADGFSIAEDLRQQYPGYFTILSTVMVTFQFRDQDSWLERTTPIITTYPDGSLRSIQLNNRSIRAIQLPPDALLDFYKAYLQFVGMTNDEKYQVRFKMSPGDLYIVDNERITHARSAYDNKGGERWLQGAYADRDGLQSRWRILRDKIVPRP